MNSLFNSLQEQLSPFERKLAIFFNTLEINTDNYLIDHVAVRTESESVTNDLKNELLNRGSKVLSSVNIKDRDIYNLQFAVEDFVTILNQKVELLELSNPIVGEPCDGKIMWEHIEIVIPGDELTLEGLEQSFKNEFPHLTEEFLVQRNIQKSSKIPSVDNDQLPNPTIKLTNSDGVEIKFHLRSLKEVIGV